MDVGVDERPDQPGPDGALMVGPVPFQGAAAVRPRIGGVLWREGSKSKRREQVIARRVMSSHRMGFHAGETGSGTEDEIRDAVAQEDLLEYGFIPELIGRLPVAVGLHGLTKDDMVRVLTEPKNAVVKQFEHLFTLDGVELSFTPAAIVAAAEQAMTRKTGARGLRTIIEEALLDVMFELPSLEHVRRCVIDADGEGQLSRPRLLTPNGQVVEILDLGGAKSA